MSNQLNIAAQERLNFGPFYSQLDCLEGKRVIFRTDYTKECYSVQSFRDEGQCAYVMQEFSSVSREKTIAGVDSSCVLIGETAEGAICAGRVCAVTAMGGKIQSYKRLGPVIFYLSPESLEHSFSQVPRKILHLLTADRKLAERFVRNRLERWVQLQLTKELTDAVIMIDGSLRGSILELGGISLADLEDKCEDSYNQLVGISKSSSLKVVSSACYELSSCKRGSVYFDVTAPARILLPGISCKVLIVKFSPNSPTFRVDMSRKNGEEESQILADVKCNDQLFRGYPESLRLAHHLSIIDSATISSIRSYLARKYRLRSLPADDLRATILGRLV